MVLSAVQLGANIMSRTYLELNAVGWAVSSQPGYNAIFVVSIQAPGVLPVTVQRKTRASVELAPPMAISRALATSSETARSASPPYREDSDAVLNFAGVHESHAAVSGNEHMHRSHGVGIEDEGDSHEVGVRPVGGDL